MQPILYCFLSLLYFYRITHLLALRSSMMGIFSLRDTRKSEGYDYAMNASASRIGSVLNRKLVKGIRGIFEAIGILPGRDISHGEIVQNTP